MQILGKTLGMTLAALIAMSGAMDVSHAGWKDLKKRLKKKAERKVERKIENKADQAMDAVINCAMGDAECIRKAEQNGQEVNVVDDQGNTVPPEQAEQQKKQAKLGPGEGVWDNYDFTPGERVLFFENFTDDTVGDFPRRFEFKKGALEVVEWQGQRFLRATQGSVLEVPLPEELPEKFTIEFDFHDSYNASAPLYLYPSGKYNSAPRYNFGPRSGGMDGAGGIRSSSNTPDNLKGQLIRGRLMVDGRYAKSYINGHRVTNVPNADVQRSDKISFWLRGSTEHPAYITNISINAGGLDMYDALEQGGRYVTQGIYFDTGSARLRPESTPTLKKIAQMLDSYPDLKITIEGHTDSVGDDASNLTLSEDRAGAVRKYLTRHHGVDPTRLTFVGYGEAKPAASNDTPEGRQKNRRVELVKNS